MEGTGTYYDPSGFRYPFPLVPAPALPIVYTVAFPLSCFKFPFISAFALGEIIYARPLFYIIFPYWVDDDGTEYYGNRIDGKIEGEGKAVYKNGDVYEGEFKAGLRDGKGTLSSSGVVIYDGEWKDNVEEGSGINYFPEILFP